VAIDYTWRGEISDSELVALTMSHGGAPMPGWWDRIRPHSLGWVAARDERGAAAGFVNVARAAGCEWLHVDHGELLAAFYVDACGFDPTHAALMHLRPTHPRD